MQTMIIIASLLSLSFSYLELSNVLRLTMEVLCGYQRLSHDILPASGFDLSKLLTPVEASADLPDNMVEILTLLLGAPAGSLKWHHPVCCVVHIYLYYLIGFRVEEHIAVLSDIFDGCRKWNSCQYCM